MAESQGQVMNVNFSNVGQTSTKTTCWSHNTKEGRGILNTVECKQRNQSPFSIRSFREVMKHKTITLRFDSKELHISDMHSST
jgi:hypothetical protein